ncbi:hypothetical protein BJ742DRAFT_822512 [Cladochytrium replicatum]|nr:hypothetical protein BJ742DRAFT_822512 [Cladochytrium replicatum]
MASSNSSSSSAQQNEKQPTVLICIGMAGSGKTTFMQRLNAHMHSTQKRPYVINLDPAVGNLPFGANVDIRDTVNYKEVMKQYNLGPNGGILTSLNLFTTKFDQVLELVSKRAPSVDYVLLDTPGQIEIFTWSASGAIITSSLAVAYPTCVVYVVDTPRSTAPATFMSNMLYACSILYKTRLPFIVVFNKTDVVDHSFAVEWMTDFEAFQAALTEDTTYMGTLVNSMCLVLEEFYRTLRVVGVSAITGAGLDEFFKAVDECVGEYDREYRVELEERMKAKEKESEGKRQENLEKLMRDMKVEKGKEVLGVGKPDAYPDDDEMGEDDDDGDDDDIAEDFAGRSEERSFERFVKSKRT